MTVSDEDPGGGAGGGGDEAGGLHAGEVAGEQGGAGLLGLVHQRGAGGAGERRVDVEHELPLDLGELGGAVERVAQHDHPLVAAGDHRAEVAGCVTGREACREAGDDRHAVAVDQLDVLLDRPQPCGSLAATLRLHHEVLPVGGPDVDGRVRERRRTVGLEPAHVVAVEVRHDDRVDLGRLDAERVQALHQLAAVEHLVVHVADARIEQGQMVAGAHHERAHRHDELTVGIEQVAVLGPVAPGPHVGHQERGAVVRRLDRDVTHAHPSTVPTGAPDHRHGIGA